MLGVRPCRFTPETRQISLRGLTGVNKRLNVSNNAVKSPARGRTSIVTVDPDGSDAWRLDQVVEMIKDGAVGCLPTDSYPALVCDLENKNAVQLLYELKGASPSKSLSILCRNFSDISKYTLGFPVSNQPGAVDFYRIAKKILPGPYTLILRASKELPKQVINYDSKKSKRRTSVGVRLPDDAICQAVLAQLDGPLLCSTAATQGEDAAVIADLYGPRGLAFVVDVGSSLTAAQPSTVIDLSGNEPEIIRVGKGDVSFLE